MLLFLKTHVEGYTRKDGVVVAAHEDKRQKHSPEQMAKWAAEKKARESAQAVTRMQEIDSEKQINKRRADGVASTAAGKDFELGEVEAIRDYYMSGDKQGALAEGRNAAVSAIERQLRAAGVEIEHVSESQGGKSKSLYVKVGGDVVRVSDHELPMTAQRKSDRDAGRSGRWSREVIVSDWHTTPIADYVADIKGGEVTKSHPATRTMISGDPTPEQAKAGDYPKLRQDWHGLTIAIENPEGTVREGVDETGKPWRTVFRYAYGEILGTLGMDGDPVDVFIGSYPEAPEVYVVQQMKRKQWDVADEQKCMINFSSIEDARQAYLQHYDDPRFFGGITSMPVAEFIAKVRATRDAPAMIKAVLFFKAHVGPYLRGGKVVNLAGYQGRPSRAVASPGQMSLFGGPSSGKPLAPSPLQGKDAVAHTPDLFSDEPQHIENMHGLDANKRLPDHNPASHGDSHNYGSNVVAKKPAGSWAYTNEHGKHHVLFSTGAGKYSSTDMLDSREAAFKQAKERMKARGLIDETQHTEPTRELIAEHERLVGVLNSPSHADDKAEAKKQAAELAEMKQEAGEHNHLLADIPGAKWRRGKGHIAGQYGVEVDGNVLGGYHAKPEDAVADYKQRAATRAQWAEDEARHTAAVGNLRERLLSGGEPTDADLKLLGLKDGSSGLKWFIPAAAKVFGITSHAVRPHIKDMIRIGHTDMGTKLEFVSPKKALQAIAAGLAPKPAYTPATDDDHPAPMPRSLMRGVPEDKLDEWKDLHRQQHELHHYELGQVREKLERHRSKRNKAQTALRESEAAVASLRGAPVRDPAREAEAQKMVDKHHAEFTKLAREQDALVGQHQSLYEKIAKLGRAKDKILDGSGDIDRDFASMAKRSASEQQDHEKSMLKMYREHYKAKDAERKRKPAPMIKSITILRSPQSS